MLPVPSGIRWDPRSNPINYRGIQWDPRSTVELHHGIRLDLGSNTAVSQEIFWDHRSDFGIHGQWTCLLTKSPVKPILHSDTGCEAVVSPSRSHGAGRDDSESAPAGRDSVTRRHALSRHASRPALLDGPRDRAGAAVTRPGPSDPAGPAPAQMRYPVLDGATDSGTWC